MIFEFFFIPETQYNRAETERQALAAAQLERPSPQQESQTEMKQESQADIPEKEGSNISTSDANVTETNGADLTIVESQIEPKKSYLQSLAFYDKSYDSGESFLANFLKPFPMMISPIMLYVFFVNAFNMIW